MALDCPLSSLSQQLQDRTLIYHTIHGIARYLVSPVAAGSDPHPLDLAFKLGLSSKIRWYPSDYSALPKIDRHWSSTISRIMHEFGGRPIWELDSLMLRIRLQQLTAVIGPDDLLSSRATWHRLLSNYADYFVTESDFAKESIMKDHDFSKVPQDVYNKLDAALSSLEKSLLEKDPLMKNHLRESHALLITYPETVVLLKPNEINTLIAAAEKHTQTQIVADVVKGKSGGSRSKKQATLDDI